MDKKPEKFRIISISPNSAHYHNRKYFIGLTCISKSKPLISGWNHKVWIDIEDFQGKLCIGYRYFLKIKLLAL